MDSSSLFGGYFGVNPDYTTDDRPVDAIPLTVAGLVLGAVATLVAFKIAGFRFSFGVSAGGGR